MVPRFAAFAAMVVVFGVLALPVHAATPKLVTATYFGMPGASTGA